MEKTISQEVAGSTSPLTKGKRGREREIDKSFHIFGPFTLIGLHYDCLVGPSSTKPYFKIAIFHTDVVIVTGIDFFEVGHNVCR